MLYTLLPAFAGFLAAYMVILYGMDGAYKYESMMDAALNVALITTLALTIGNVLKYYRPSNGKEWNVALWILILTSIWWWISANATPWITGNNAMYSQMLSATLALRICLVFMVLGSVSLITWIRRQGESDTKSMERYNEMKELARDAELNALRQQLQPHFLFNSLNSIQSLTSIDPEKAGKMVIQLSDFLRGTMRKITDTQQTVEKEIEHARLYLEIEKVRFGNRLQVSMNVDPECLDKSVPALVLQPIVENAIKHGLYQKTEEVAIEINVKNKGQVVSFEVLNPYDPQAKEQRSSTGFGLSSLKRRLYLLYGRQDLLLTSAQEGIFKVEILIPFA